eukprot:tig00021532_g22196.t1
MHPAAGWPRPRSGAAELLAAVLVAARLSQSAVLGAETDLAATIPTSTSDPIIPGPPPTIQAVFLWIGFSVFALATVCFVALFFLNGKREHYVLNFFCVAIAALGYYANANGMGVINVNGYTVNFARYLDWSITTPLLVIDLAELGERPFAVKLTLVFADFLMIATGLFSALCPAPMRWGFYVFSCLFFFVLLFILYQGYARTLRLLPTDKDRNLFRGLMALFIATWHVYPVIFVVGTEGVRVLNPDVEIIILTFTDLTAKVVFGFIYLKLEDNKYEADIEKRLSKEAVFFEDENGVKYVRASDGVALDEAGKIRMHPERIKKEEKKIEKEKFGIEDEEDQMQMAAGGEGKWESGQAHAYGGSHDADGSTSDSGHGPMWGPGDPRARGPQPYGDRERDWRDEGPDRDRERRRGPMVPHDYYEENDRAGPPPPPYADGRQTPRSAGARTPVPNAGPGAKTIPVGKLRPVLPGGQQPPAQFGSKSPRGGPMPMPTNEYTNVVINLDDEGAAARPAAYRRPGPDRDPGPYERDYDFEEREGPYRAPSRAGFPHHQSPRGGPGAGGPPPMSMAPYPPGRGGPSSGLPRERPPQSGRPSFQYEMEPTNTRF